MGLLVMTTWGIWTNRNEVNHGKSQKPTSALARWTKEYLENYVMANHSTRPYKESVEATWQPPSLHGTKPTWTVQCFLSKRKPGLGL